MNTSLKRYTESSPGMMAVVTARTVSGAALSVPQATKIGAEGTRPITERKHAAYLGKGVSLSTSVPD